MKKGKYWITQPGAGTHKVRFHFNTKREWEARKKKLSKKGYVYRAGKHK